MRQKILSANISQTIFCLNKSQFLDDSRNNLDFINKQKASNIDLIKNNDGTIKYLYENFDKYGDTFSRSVEQFESTDGWIIKGPIADLKQNKEKYNGNYSLSMTTSVSADNLKEKDHIILKKYFDKPINFSRWEKEGFVTAWMKIQERKGIVGVGLRIGDKTNTYREFIQLSNLQINVSNNYDQDDLFPDLAYPIKENDSDEWTDFWLSKGWNYLPWRMDKEYYFDSGSIDMTNINWIEIRLEVNGNLTKQEILFDDLRVQDGLQKEKNPLGGFWYPPNGRPQYGVFDVDKLSNNDYILRLLNVRQTQYPSNGDHARMISKYNTPLNFAMKTKFMLTDFVIEERKRENTWFRVTYDFEPDYDPGHDWFGAYLSSEWKKFGLITVIPLEKSTSQDQEPKNDKISLSSKDFTPKENIIYELDVTIHGQKAKATIYAVGDNCLKMKSQVEYQFSRLRYDKRYPIAIESTGNVTTNIYEIEIIEL